MNCNVAKLFLIGSLTSILLSPLRAESIFFDVGTPWNNARAARNGNPYNFSAGMLLINGVVVTAGGGGGSTNTILNGSGVPSAGLGSVGDFYIRTDVTPRDLYGPKSGGGWGSATSMGGPAGATGATGATGPGVAAGGSTGQALVKNSATNYDTGWVTVATPATRFPFTQIDNQIAPATQIPASYTNPTYATITQSGATLTFACDAAKHTQQQTTTLTANVTTFTITSIVNGMTGNLIVKQDATGSRTLTLPATSKVVNNGGAAITLTTTANAIDVLSWTYDGTNIFWTYGKNFN